MDRNTAKDHQPNDDMPESETIRECVEDEEKTVDRNASPHIGEDPGLLETNEDPRERRLKRNTM